MPVPGKDGFDMHGAGSWGLELSTFLFISTAVTHGSIRCGNPRHKYTLVRSVGGSCQAPGSWET